MTIAELIRRSVTSHADRIAIADDTRSWTYATVGERSFRLVNALTARGIRPGDRVATLTHNDITSLEMMLGLALGGYARTALHAMNSGDTHRQMLQAAGARALITTAEFASRFAADLKEVSTLEHVIVQGLGSSEEADYESALAAAYPVDAMVPVTGEDVIHLAFSSGSTGIPRASVHTHESWLAVTEAHAAFLPRVRAADRYLAAAPLTHAASTVLYLLVGRGAAIRVLPRFDAARALDVIEAERCSMTFLVPTMLRSLITHDRVSATDLSSLRAVMYASAPISVETASAAQRALGDVLFQSYGQSECLPVTALTPEDHAAGVSGATRLLASAGRPCLHARVKIVDGSGNELPAGATGEILVSTPGQMRGIFNDPALTAERITGDGFVRTNDIGRIGPDGYLFVLDRKNDMIISGGFNIWPAEIELALAEHPAVSEAVVVGVPHPKWGETPHAVVVLQKGQHVTEAELIEHCRARIGSMKKPATVLITDELPRNELGKLPRRAIRDRYWPTGPRERDISGA